jgi:serine/threonine-protein kinase
VTALGEKNDFIYTEIVSESGELLKGWLRKQDVTLKGDSLTQRAEETNPEIRSQLQNAKRFFNEGKTVEALIIYNTLAKSEVPEAMYHYGKLALQNKNANISCTEAFELLKKASDKGLTDAKTTLGFIYSFADDKAMLQRSNYYERCSFGKNVSKGSKLLVEAMLEGDTAASRLIDTLNVRQRKG